MSHNRTAAVVATVFIGAVALVTAGCGSDSTEALVEPVADSPLDATDTDTTAVDDTASTDSNPVDDPASDDTAEHATPGMATAEPTLGDEFPDIIAVQATREDAGTWRFDVTVSSPYDTPQRYADAWRVLDPDGNELGIRVLTHDHANEQPFTRSQGGIAIPDDVTEVVIQGRDQANGWGGGELTVTLPR